MRFFSWLSRKWSNFWGKVFFLGALLVCAMIFCWCVGWQCNILILGAFLLGLWAVRMVAKRLNPGVNPKELLKNFYWYIATFICTAGFFLIFFKSSLLYMYLDWSTAHRGIAGFAQIFAPIIVLTAASTGLATIAQTRKFATLWIWFCLITSVIGLMGFRLVRPLDQFGGVKQEELANKLDASRLNMEKGLGLYAVVKNSQMTTYDNKSSKIGLFYPYNNPNDNFKFSVDSIIPLNKKDFVVATGTGGKFVEVKIGNKIRWVSAQDVEILAGAEVVDDEYAFIVKKGQTWYVKLLSDAPVKLLENWDEKVVALYEAPDGILPQVNAGQGFTTLDNGFGMIASGRPLIIKWKKGGKIVLNFCKKT